MHDAHPKETVEAVRHHALNATRNSYSPYSGCRVGAAAITEDGTILTGCNVENPSFAMTLCAEATLLGTMVAGGHKSLRFISCRLADGSHLPPCGRCRQMLMELVGAQCLVDLGEAGVVELSTLYPHAYVGQGMNGARS
jgi:cytidine deaminase